MKLIAILALTTALLAACGGGGGGSDATPTAPKQIPAVSIDATGDSTMHGYQPGVGTTPNSAPVELQRALQAAFDSTVTVQNNGSVGARLTDLLLGNQPFYSTAFTTSLSTNSAQIVLENYGINDSNSRTPDEYAADLNTWIADVRAVGKIPVLEEPNPVCRADMTHLDAFVDVLRNVAKQQGVTLIEQYDYIRGLPNWQSMLADCIHPNDALYAIKAQREAAVLIPIVAKLRG
ncbi:SGNH/GDSL hydrolase family protein [Burkholderia vietnamiensis]|nr:SGNH/GDSL hydrolase family protein [Burkholderia vietnamiensis]